MADTKVSELQSITVAGDNDILYIVNSTAGTSNKITFGNLAGNSITNLNTKVNTLSDTLENVSTFTGEVSSLGKQTDINALSSDISLLKGNASHLDSDITSVQRLLESGISRDVVIGSSTYTFLSGLLVSIT